MANDSNDYYFYSLMQNCENCYAKANNITRVYHFLIFFILDKDHNSNDYFCIL